MNKVFSIRRMVFASIILFFTVLMPLPGLNAVAFAKTTSSTEEKQTEIKLNVKKKSLVKDTSYTLVLYNLSDDQKTSFKSSDSDIASVDKDGVVTALKVGEATITVTVKENHKTVATLTCDITVGLPAYSIRTIKSEITLTVGKSTLLDIILKPNDTVERAKFSSRDTSIATVSSNGRVTAKSAGTTYIYGTINNGQYVKILVTVVESASVESESTTSE